MHTSCLGLMVYLRKRSLSSLGTLVLAFCLGSCGEESTQGENPNTSDPNSNGVNAAGGGTNSTGGSQTLANMAATGPTATSSAAAGGAIANGGAATAGSAGDMAVGGAPATGEAGASGMQEGNMPADDSLEAMQAFLSQELYNGEGWTAQTDSPRDPSSTVSPHGRVRVHLNDTLLASKAAGNGGILAETQHTVGSMAVKEMFDETDTRVGVAALYKIEEGGSEAWLYHCYAPESRCYSGGGTVSADSPLHEQNRLDCGICHGGEVFTSLD